jgi:YbbR domain-containing protein
MFVRFRENLFYKVFALCFAIALHFYVVGQENPTQPRIIVVPLTARSIPADLIFDDKTAPQISVTLIGPADAVSRLPEADVVAWVDLSRAHKGKNVGLRVHVDPPPGGSAVTVSDPQPQTLTLTLPARATRRVQIGTGNPGTPPAGFMFEPAKVTPKYATLIGSQDAVNSVQQVVANVDGGTAIGTIDNDFPVVPLDSQGAQVNVPVTPQIAHVRIVMRRVPAAKILLVSPNLVGAPPYPYKVTGIDVSPQNVTVTGRPELLAQAYNIQTSPVDISGATADVTRQVTCVLPLGVMLSGTGQVTVTVHIAAQPTPSTPAPSGPTVITPTEPQPQ